MRLTNAESARKALARMMNLYRSGDIEGDVFVRLQRAFNTLLDYFKFDRDEEVNAKLDRIEAMLQEAEQRRTR